jgi:cysteine desulfurase
MAVYLDHAASSPMRPEALAVFIEQLGVVGNPSSVHRFGQTARRALEEARESLAKSIDCNRNEIVFTAGGTESDNLAIKGLFWQRNSEDSRRTVIISAATEHHAVIDPIEWLAKAQGAEMVWVPVDERGVVDLPWLAKFVAERGDEVALITLMWANNETGVITDIGQVVEIAKTKDIPVHSDAVAAVGHMPISFAKSGLTALTFTAHKVGGPVGVGALVIARAAKLTPSMHGGNQERGMRSGTMNAAGAVAFARATEVAIADLEEHAESSMRLRDRVIEGVLAVAPEARFSRGDAPGLPDNVHFTFPGCSGDSLLFLLDIAGVSVSTGSACTAGVSSASHVLLAMGRSEKEATGCLRVSLGYTNTDACVDEFLAALPNAYEGAKKAGLPSK